MAGTIYQGVLAPKGVVKGTVYQVRIVGGAAGVDELPDASAELEGKIFQYTGETTADYHKGYFYEAYQTGTAPSVATIEQTAGEGLEDLAVDKDTFETQITEAGEYDFVARLNREHITATIGEQEGVRLDRDEMHDVEGAIAWTPDGETYFYTEELVPDVDDEIFADPDGAEVAGAVESYAAEDMGWVFDGDFVDIEDYGITYTPADPTATVEYSSEALGTVTVDADTFATQVAESDLYIFDAVVTPERILATVSEDMIQYNRDADDDDADLFAWKDEHNVVVFTDSATPSANDDVYSDTAKTPLGTVDGYSASSTKWYRGSDEITLATYGIAITGTAEDGNVIHIQYVSEPPHQDDVITVTYAEAYDTFGWRRINAQPASGGAEGTVDSVNNVDPVDGNVELSAENIDAEVGGTIDSVQDHLVSLRNDLGDLADDVDGKQGKITGTKGNVLYINQNGNVGDVALNTNLTELDDQEVESLSGLAETQAEVNEEFVEAITNMQAQWLGTGYDATKTQVLKNIQGVLTWVDEE